LLQPDHPEAGVRTGPRTAGKARVAQNARRHGLSVPAFIGAGVAAEIEAPARATRHKKVSTKISTEHNIDQAKIWRWAIAGTQWRTWFASRGGDRDARVRPYLVRVC
jgi:hypothetical protein